MFQSIKTKLAAAAALTLPAAVAFAQVTDPFDAAVTSISDKVETYGAALITVAVIGVVLSVGVKYVKKLRGAA